MKKMNIFGSLLIIAVLLSLTACSSKTAPAPLSPTPDTKVALPGSPPATSPPANPDSTAPPSPPATPPPQEALPPASASPPSSPDTALLPLPDLSDTPITSVKEFTMEAKMFEFIPSEIRVNKGDMVRIKVKATDVAHSFTLMEYNINQQLSPGKEETIEFVADKRGTFTFSCAVFCGSGHRDMKGTLIVE